MISELPGSRDRVSKYNMIRLVWMGFDWGHSVKRMEQVILQGIIPVVHEWLVGNRMFMMCTLSQLPCGLPSLHVL